MNLKSLYKVLYLLARVYFSAESFPIRKVKGLRGSLILSGTEITLVTYAIIFNDGLLTEILENNL